MGGEQSRPNSSQQRNQLARQQNQQRQQAPYQGPVGNNQNQSSRQPHPLAQQRPNQQQQIQQVPPIPQPINQQRQDDPRMQFMDQALNPNRANQYQQIYRKMTQNKRDLKNFKLLVYLNKESIKVNTTADNKLELSFKVDSLSDCLIRVNTCVSEKKNINNVPEMMYTPNKDDYTQEIHLKKGMQQEINFNQCKFDLAKMTGFELHKCQYNYYPITFSVNYQGRGKFYAFIIYGYFNKDGNNKINGVHITKQLVIINGIPFEIKNIYGLNMAPGTTAEGEASDSAQEGVADDGDGKECLICLTEPRDTLIMPCSHLCVCRDCGNQIQQKKYTCPICRGNIGSLIPIDMIKKAKKT